MDYKLGKAIINEGVPLFVKSLKNKDDSQSCIFDLNKLLSSPETLGYIARKMARIILVNCRGNTLVGLTVSGVPWGAIASVYSGRPFLYVRKKLEKRTSNKCLEGVIPKNAKVILIDDLLFAGKSKIGAIETIKKYGLTVTDIIVIVDRQLQRKKDGPSLQNKYQLKLHSLITMDEIVGYMIKKEAISKIQLEALVRDYRQYERWDTPGFAV